MYSASEQFHIAVLGNSPKERILFSFADGTIFTNEDVMANPGVKIMESANLEEELTIGACPSSSLSATIANYNGLLSGYTFGECKVYIGIRTRKNIYPVGSGNVSILINGVRIEGNTTEPYLTAGGSATQAQPPFPVYAILASGYKLYCIGQEGQVWETEWSDGQTWNDVADDTWEELSDVTWEELHGVYAQSGQIFQVNSFMTNKLTQWASTKKALVFDKGILNEFYQDGTVETYEYVPMGVFNINTPEKRKVDLIEIVAYDKMTLFDVEADDFLPGLTYPITLGEIYAQLCQFVGVTNATQTFINSTKSFTQPPVQTTGITAKDILKWIAEASCTYSRMTRDGENELAWFAQAQIVWPDGKTWEEVSTYTWDELSDYTWNILAGVYQQELPEGQTQAIYNLPMTQYFSATIAEYQVAQIDKLQVIGTENDIGVIVGNGTNGYSIVDNPFLYGESDTEVRPYVVLIYNQLSQFPAFSPVMATAVCDWSIEAGDIISIETKDSTYLFPVYCQTITWNGCARVSYESTGTELRPVMDQVNRTKLAQGRQMHELSVTIDGLSSAISNTDGRVTELELTVDGLSLEVSNGETSSTLTLKSGEASLSSANITFTGIVTFKSLSTAGSTQINGANITTGTISADRIDVANLYVQKLNSATGSFNQLASTGYNPSISFGEMRLDNSGMEFGELYIERNQIAIGSSIFTPNRISLNIVGAGSVEIGTVPGYGDVSFLPPAAYTGNIGIGSRPWDQCVADKLYSSSGDVGQFSMRKLKDDIQIFSMDDDMIDQFQAVSFVMKSDKCKRRQIGWIADDVQDICPELICAFQDVSMDEPILTLNYGKIGVIAIDEIQKLRKRVKALEERICAL